MAGDPHPVFQDDVPPQKANARTFLPLRLGNPDALRALDSSTFWLVFINSLSKFFWRNTSDTTSADDGESVIHDANGQRWHVVSATGGINIDAAGDIAERDNFDDVSPPFAFYALDEQLLYIKNSASSADWSDGFSIKGDGLHIDAVGTFSGRDTFDDEATGFVYASTDGDGDTITTSVLFRKASGSSADWSDPIPLQGPTGESDVAPSIVAADAKTTPHDDDQLGIVDSEASSVLKKLTFANLWAWVLAKIFGTVSPGTMSEASNELDYDVLSGAKTYFEHTLGDDAELQAPSNAPVGSTIELLVNPDSNAFTFDATVYEGPDDELPTVTVETLLVVKVVSGPRYLVHVAGEGYGNGA